MSVEIIWYGHSCMKIDNNGYTIVFDPYKDDSVPGYPSLHIEANQVLCTHQHADHCGIENVKIISTDRSCPWNITEIHSYHDENQGKKRGMNTIYLLEDDLLRMAHMGDTGCMPTAQQMELLKDLDVMMVPIGGFYTMEIPDIKMLIAQLKPKAVIPMHYRFKKFGYDEIGTLEPFIQNEKKVQYIDTLEINKKDRKSGIFILKNHNA